MILWRAARVTRGAGGMRALQDAFAAAQLTRAGKDALFANENSFI